MPESLGALEPGSALDATINAYRTCELATIGKDGTPMAWPTSGISRPDGTFLLTTSLGFPQKAFNIRRDPRVAVLFSEPHASGLDAPAQILIKGKAVCPDEVHTAPDGDLADFWLRLFERQPSCQKYLDWPATALTDFYFMRLLVTVSPEEITTRPLPPPGPVLSAREAGAALLGGEVLAAYSSVVLASLDADGAPTLLRTTVAAEGGRYRVALPEDAQVAGGRASLLVHRHDDQLTNLHSAVVTGTLEDGLLTPERLIEPAQRSKAGLAEPIRIVRNTRATTKKYLAKRGLERPSIPWKAYRELRATL
ncbi:pyridoxamine 5'-phosphate oxidase family protein [Actinoplanes sp. NPDC026619]|uniref:pyridoxamine 5'-phosphate oxidase family protein n=1 Tax=Actinoplanes sp. NPDC026619 TaxID=3155798 RepID=UPI003409434B